MTYISTEKKVLAAKGWKDWKEWRQQSKKRVHSVDGARQTWGDEVAAVDEEDEKHWAIYEHHAMAIAELEGNVLHSMQKLVSKKTEVVETEKHLWSWKKMQKYEEKWATMETEDMEAEERVGKLAHVMSLIETELEEAKRTKRRRTRPVAPASHPLSENHSTIRKQQRSTSENNSTATQQ